jgi:uncharacterized OB-fold protein
MSRPLPHPDFMTAAYWSHVRDHELWLPRCENCKKFHFYPRAICPYCRSDAIAWEKASGQGEVYSFTIVKRAPSPAFEKMVPYCVAIVALDEGPHLMTDIVETDPEQVRIGARASVRYLDIEGEEPMTIPVFALDESTQNKN